jgi:hypothetical protein
MGIEQQRLSRRDMAKLLQEASQGLIADSMTFKQIYTACKAVLSEIETRGINK